MRVLSGIQPTGSVHLGNYLGAIKQWVPFQNQAETLFCIVDLHALTTGYIPPEQLRESVYLMAACYIACGIDTKKSSIFVQSHVPEHTELSWLLSCVTPLGWLNRMTQFKDKAGNDKEQASLGLYAYPVLMAADILLYKATHVPVGADQKQHLEIARDIAQAFNRHIGQAFFPLPEPCILGGATRVMSLRDGRAKMSKSDVSDFSRIHIADDAETISRKIRKAKTDGGALPSDEAELQDRPEAENLLRILAALEGVSLQEALRTWGGKNFGQLKPYLTDVMIARLSPIRQEMAKLMQAKDHLQGILKEGAQKARVLARQTREDVAAFIGIGPY